MVKMELVKRSVKDEKGEGKGGRLYSEKRSLRECLGGVVLKSNCYEN